MPVPYASRDDCNIASLHYSLLVLGRDHPFAFQDVKDLVGSVNVRDRPCPRVKEDREDFCLARLLGPRQGLHVNGTREMWPIRRLCLSPIHPDNLHENLLDPIHSLLR